MHFIFDESSQSRNHEDVEVTSHQNVENQYGVSLVDTNDD